jgi:hypothetical protein
MYLGRKMKRKSILLLADGSEEPRVLYNSFAQGDNYVSNEFLVLIF